MGMSDICTLPKRELNFIVGEQEEPLVIAHSEKSASSSYSGSTHRPRTCPHHIGSLLFDIVHVLQYLPAPEFRDANRTFHKYQRLYSPHGPKKNFESNPHPRPLPSFALLHKPGSH